MSLCRYYEDTNSPNDLVLAEISDSLTEKIDYNEGKSNLSTTELNKRKAAAHQEECVSSRIAGPSSSTAESELNTERKLSKAEKESQKKKQRKIGLSVQDDTEEIDGKLYADFCVLLPNS